MEPEQLTAIERYWRNRTAPLHLYDRDRGLINATADLLALVEALHHAWREGEQLRRRQPDMQPTAKGSLRSMAHLRISAFLSRGERSGGLVIFDKDGTLIDFHAMWGGWITTLARRLEAASSISVAPRLFHRVGFDSATGAVDPNGPLAIATMADLRAIAADVLRGAGLPAASAEAAAQAAWYIPDPVALARPLADLPRLFGALRARGQRIAIATTDDRAPTAATVAALGIASLVDGLACGDDGHALKPAPDAVLELCRQLGVAPAQATIIGDTVADLRMGRSAGVGRVIGVLSGVGTAELLAPYADVLLPSVAALMRDEF